MFLVLFHKLRQVSDVLSTQACGTSPVHVLRSPVWTSSPCMRQWVSASVCRLHSTPRSARKHRGDCIRDTTWTTPRHKVPCEKYHGILGQWAYIYHDRPIFTMVGQVHVSWYIAPKYHGSLSFITMVSRRFVPWYYGIAYWQGISAMVSRSYCGRVYYHCILPQNTLVFLTFINCINCIDMSCTSVHTSTRRCRGHVC